jgi:PAS domain S-box-containing protein
MENSAFLTNYEGQPTTLATRCAASEHGRAEAELRFQIEMMSHMPGGVAVIRASDGVIVYASQAFVEMFGYDRPEELAGKHISIVNAPGEKSPEAVSKEIMAALQNEPGVWSGEIRNIRKDGTPFWSFNKISTYEHHEHGKVWISIKTDITERKQTEEDIYRKLYDNAPAMLASVDPSTARIVQCNQTIATALGYTKEELVGRSVLEIYHPDSIERAKEAFWSFVNAGVFRDLELQLERKDGSVIDTSLNVSAIRDEQGNIVYSNLIWHDITRRKQAEEALRESEERFRLATSAGKVGVWDWDVVANTVTWSDTIYNVHGLEPGEFGGTVEAFAELVHADDRDYVNEAIRRAL